MHMRKGLSMKEQYAILPPKMNNSRHSVIFFAALTVLYILVVQIATALGDDPAPHAKLPFLLGPAILMILAGALRSYFFFLLANIYAVVRVAVQVILTSLEDGTYTSAEILDVLVLFLLVTLAGALAWQAILFYTGHADNVALTHTSLLCSILCFVFIFFPYIVRLFVPTLPVTETWDALFLSFSFLAFSHGIEKLPAKAEK